jgi:polyhydroxyalkanoate synthesis repressor PhaR
MGDLPLAVFLLIATRKMPRTRALVNSGKNTLPFQPVDMLLTNNPVLRLLNDAGLPRCRVMSLSPSGAIKLACIQPGNLGGKHVSEEKSKGEGPVVIKKYANRRLYNTQTSSYVTLDHLAAMVKEGTEFEVQDARTGEDITRPVLTQIIFEEEAKGQSLLPIKFLRQLIRFYGDSLQSFVPGYLDMSMDGFTKNQGAMRDRIAEALGGGNQMVENLTRQNLQMFENAMAMFAPFGVGAKGGEASVKSPVKPAEDIADLKEEMEAMRRQLAELSQRK